MYTVEPQLMKTPYMKNSGNEKGFKEKYSRYENEN